MSNRDEDIRLKEWVEIDEDYFTIEASENNHKAQKLDAAVKQNQM